MIKVDYMRELKHLYTAPTREPVVVDVGEMAFLMVDGSGDPNTSQAYREAVQALYSVSYALKFAIKRSAGQDYGVMPLEGLWWVDDMSAFTTLDKSAWSWTMMIMQPLEPDERLLQEATAAAVSRRHLPAADSLRLRRFREGLAAQMTHVGPFSSERPTIERLHAFIAAQGRERAGKHHEIYLTDPSRTAPERMRTIIRQPFRAASGRRPT